MQTNRALCEMCRRTMNGEEITEEAVREYEAQKLGRANVSLLVLEEPPTQAKEFSLRSMTGEFVRAFKFLLKPRPEAPVSKTVSKTKRRGRLFDTPEIGSMLQVDETLKKQQE